MNFGQALETLKKDKIVARKNWNGNGMWLRLVHEDEYFLEERSERSYFNPAAKLAPWIGMLTADNKFVPWLASQTDILAEDWEEVTP